MAGELVGVILLVAASVYLGWTDWRSGKIKNGSALAAACGGVALTYGGAHDWLAALSLIGRGLAMSLAVLIVLIVSTRWLDNRASWLGGGDIKSMAAMSFALTPAGTVLLICGTILVGQLVGRSLQAKHCRLGPVLALGAMFLVAARFTQWGSAIWVV